MRFRNLRRLVQAARLSMAIWRSKAEKTYLIAHCEPPVINRRPPEVSNEGDVEEVDQVQPSIQDEPPRLPVIRDESGVAPRSKGEGVEEEEGEYNQDTAQNTPPELLVHHSLDILLPVKQILHRKVQGV